MNVVRRPVTRQSRAGPDRTGHRHRVAPPQRCRLCVTARNGADGLGRLVAEWEEGRTPSDLSDYLPDPAKIRRAALIELVGIDMEYRWLKNDCPKRLTDYCAEYPELLEEPLPAELLYEEFRLRKQGGEDVTAAEYLSEFPLQAESFEQMFDRDSMAGREDVMMLGLSGFDEFEIGQHLDDFELVLELGHGAFARVFLARQLSMQRWVALKISRNVGVEPQTLAQLDHPNIVPGLRSTVARGTRTASPVHGIRAGWDPARRGQTCPRDTAGAAVRTTTSRRHRQDPGEEGRDEAQRDEPEERDRCDVVAGDRGLDGDATGRCPRVCAGARRITSGHQAGERTAQCRRHPQARRLQRQLERGGFDRGRCLFCRRLACLHVSGAIGGLCGGGAWHTRHP